MTPDDPLGAAEVAWHAGDGSTAGWGRLKSGAGWIALDYAKKL